MAALLAVLYREGKIRFTNLVWMFFDLFYPLLYFLLFGVMMDYTFGSPLAALGVDYTAFFLAGVLGMAGFGIATNTAWGFFFDRDNGIFYEMLTYPMSRAQFLLGKVVFNLLLAVAQAALTVGLGVLLLHVPVKLERLPLLPAGVGGGAGGFVFLFASSMFSPLEPLPGWFRAAAQLNPLTWHVDVLRFATIGVGDPWRILLEAAAFVVFSLAAFAYAVRTLQRQE